MTGARVGSAAVLALGSSLLWGTADFLGGTAARRLPAVAVMGASQVLSLAGLAVLAALTGAWRGPLDWVPWSVAGGLVGMVALVSFYAALAEGTMGVVAPIAALGVVVPVVTGVVSGERPGPLQVAGVGVAVLGVVLASGPEASAGGPRLPARPVLLAVVAAVGFGVVLVTLAAGGRSDPLMTLVGMRLTSSVAVLSLGAALRSAGGVTRQDLPLLAVVGAADAGANATFALASTSGMVSVVAVLGSLYPAVTVVLARLVHGERLRPVQNVGVVGALVGVGLIAAGGGA
ncbi:MAG: EamA family transporter [Actinomycetota bacterium]|nr:EamA family transporter [Actinomycetota bacterium]